jgi:catechol 2,3-dioxygenase-like lactoylglutathione lyase family enzyme
MSVDAGRAGRRSITHVAIVVRDYDEAIAYYTRALGFELVEDEPRERGKRWVVVAPSGGGTALLLARAATPEQDSRVGDQTGGRVFLFLETDDFARDYAAMRERGVAFEEPPRREAYGAVAIFRDLYGNRWDLIERGEGTDGGSSPPSERTARAAKRTSD